MNVESIYYFQDNFFHLFSKNKKKSIQQNSLKKTWYAIGLFRLFHFPLISNEKRFTSLKRLNKSCNAATLFFFNRQV